MRRKERMQRNQIMGNVYVAAFDGFEIYKRKTKKGEWIYFYDPSLKSIVKELDEYGESNWRIYTGCRKSSLHIMWEKVLRKLGISSMQAMCRK